MITDHLIKYNRYVSECLFKEKEPISIHEWIYIQDRLYKAKDEVDIKTLESNLKLNNFL